MRNRNQIRRPSGNASTSAATIRRTPDPRRRAQASACRPLTAASQVGQGRAEGAFRARHFLSRLIPRRRSDVMRPAHDGRR
jgi:hypothetical protein